jgi:hypothetical protein
VKDGVITIHYGEPKSVVSVWSTYKDAKDRKCNEPIADIHILGDPTPESLARQLANANLMVKAVNSYDILIDTLKKINNEDPDCGCDHAKGSDLCCVHTDMFCAKCIAGAALRKIGEL